MIQNKQQSMGLGKRTNPLLKYISYIIIYVYIFIFIHIHSTSIWWFEIYCALLLFSTVIHLFLEGKPYLHLPAKFPKVRTTRLDIDEFQAALRKVRVFSDVLRHGVCQGIFCSMAVGGPQNLETMEALGPIIWVKWPLRMKVVGSHGTSCSDVLWFHLWLL